MKKIELFAVLLLNTAFSPSSWSEQHNGVGSDKSLPEKIACNLKQGITFTYYGPNHLFNTVRIHPDGKIEHSGDEAQFSELKQNRLFEKIPTYCATIESVLKDFEEIPAEWLSVNLSKEADLDPAHIRDQILSGTLMGRMSLSPKSAEKLKANAKGKSSWIDFDKLGLNPNAARTFSLLYARAAALCANPKSAPFWLPETGKHFTPENINNLRAELAEADRLRQKDIEAADKIAQGVAKGIEVSKRKGRDPERPGEHGYSQVFLSFLRDFSEKANDDKAYCKFVDALREALFDPAVHRTLLIDNQPMLSSDISYSAVLDTLEKKLGGSVLEKFRALRKEYQLVPEKINPEQSAYLHGVSQFKIGALLTHREKAHDLPTEYVALLKEGDAPRILHHNAARDGWVITQEGKSLSRSQNQNPAAAIDAVNQKHNYMISRTVEDYTRYFDYRFAKRLVGLKKDSHVIDMGSGKGFFLEGLTQGFRANDQSTQSLKDLAAIPAGERPSATGVTIKMEREMPKFDNSRMKVFERFLDKVSDEELVGKNTPGPAEVITDVFGVFSYVDDVSGLLERYARLTTPSGSIYVVSGRKRNVVKLEAGKEVPLFEYLASLKDTGLKISDHSSREDGDLGIIIEKDGKPIKIPKLILDSAVEGEPPHRVFVVKP